MAHTSIPPVHSRHLFGGLPHIKCNSHSLDRLQRVNREEEKPPTSRACLPYIEERQVTLRTGFGQVGDDRAYHNPAYAQEMQEDDCPYCLVI